MIKPNLVQREILLFGLDAWVGLLVVADFVRESLHTPRRTGEFAVGAPDGKTIETLFRPIKSKEAGSPLEYYWMDKARNP